MDVRIGARIPLPISFDSKQPKKYNASRLIDLVMRLTQKVRQPVSISSFKGLKRVESFLRRKTKLAVLLSTSPRTACAKSDKDICNARRSVS